MLLTLVVVQVEQEVLFMHELSLRGGTDKSIMVLDGSVLMETLAFSNFTS